VSTLRSCGISQNYTCWLNNPLLFHIFIISYCHKEKNIFTIIIKGKRLIKNIPIEFVGTESTDFQSMMEERLNDPGFEDKNLEKSGMNNIPEEALRGIALDYWNKYYNEWPDIEIPFLDNKTPREAMKTDEGKQKVIDLIDDYENNNAHHAQDSGGGNIQKFFDAGELRKRMGL